jgi:sugar phosphate isomerase/epimerase
MIHLAYPFGTPETEAPLLGLRGDPEAIFPALREMGYCAIEPFVRDPKRFDTALFARQVRRFGLEVAAVGTGPVVSDDRLTFTAPDEEIRVAAIRRAMDMVEFASLFGCQVNIGKLRGEIRKECPEESWNRMREGFEQVCVHARRCGVLVTLEPQNRSVINNLNTTREGIAFVREMNLPNLMLMADIYHMHLEDQSLAVGLIEASKWLRHIHFADSNRRAPGRGSLHFAEIVRILKALCYDRFVTFEIAQGTDGLREARFAADHLRFIDAQTDEGS